MIWLHILFGVVRYLLVCAMVTWFVLYFYRGRAPGPGWFRKKPYGDAFLYGTFILGASLLIPDLLTNSKLVDRLYDVVFYPQAAIMVDDLIHEFGPRIKKKFLAAKNKIKWKMKLPAPQRVHPGTA